MGEFLTDKEVERLVEFETRYLPIPEPLITSDGRTITAFKKKPITMFVCAWKTYDTLTEEPYPIYTPNELITAAISISLDTKTDFNETLSSIVSSFFESYKKTNLPVLLEIEELRREVDEIHRRLKDKYPDYDEDE